MELAKVETDHRARHARFLLAPQPYPWLVFGDGKYGERQTFFDVSKDRYYTESIPEMCNKRIYACSHGWLVLGDRDSDDCYLWNPISLKKIQLPPLQPPLVEPFEYDLCIVLSSPNDPACHVFFFTLMVNFFLVCQIGDFEFNKQEFDNGDDSKINHVTMVGKTLYCLTFPNRTLFTVEIMGSSSQFTPLIMEELPSPAPAPREIVVCGEYLFESFGELLLIIQMLHGLYKREVYGFIVLRMDFSKKKWVRMKSIGEKTIFLSMTHGMSCLGAEFGIKPNSIYYTRPQDRFLYVFDLEDLSISKSLPCPIVSRYSTLNWIMLSSCV